MRKKIIFFLLTFLLLLTLVPIGTRAANWQNKEEIHIKSDQTIDGNLYFTTENLKVEGNINGDLIGIAQNIEINGRVEGDILAITQNFNFNGEVVGNIRILGNQININGAVGRNLNVLGVKVFLGETAQVSWDALIGANHLDVRALINGNLYALANQLFLNGQINRDVNLAIRGKEATLSLGEKLLIANTLTYRADKSAIISPEAKIKGEITHKEFPSKNPIKTIWSLIHRIFAAILVALVLVQLFKQPMRSISKTIYEKPGLSLAWGAALIILFPILIIILALTIIGFQLALALAGLWLILIIIAKVVTAVFIGRFIINRLLKKPKTKTIWKIILGISVCYLLFSLPLIGSFLFFLATILGAGAIWLELKKSINP